MSKCILCRPGNPKQYATWIWQPFGPAESVCQASRPGYHYRGFPALPICGWCLDDLVGGDRREFTYRKQTFIVDSLTTSNGNITHFSPIASMEDD